MMKRRDALKAIGRIGAAASVARFLPSCGGGSSGPGTIDTYVYMMMENRSYDHFFGARSALEGKPGDGLDLSGMTMFNKDLNGQIVYPFHPDRLSLCDVDPPHGWDPLHAAWNSGANDGFLAQHQKQYDATQQQVMQYLTRNELPVSWALADQYATADRWFCSVMGPTWPNRFYWHTGTSGGLKDNNLPGTNLPWPSIYNRLNDKGVDWAYYFGSVPVVSAIANVDVSKNVKYFDDFADDAKAGKLPSVVYIDPVFNGNDDHPPVHPINGQELISMVYTALANSPHWKSCMLVITYDENGGFYDHVSPPSTVDDQAALGFTQMGFRVPTMVVGPYVKTGHVSSTVYDHCSALRELEVAFQLEPLNQRTKAANDLSDFIDQDRLASGDWADPIEIPTVDPTTWEMPYECTHGDLFGPGGDHPVIEWADKHPEKIAGFDRRGDVASYRKKIRDYLRTTRINPAKIRARLG
ncbi:MAG TPA: alkaline phosphatase family protein [Kofleriaceae bacterium]